MIIHIIKPWCVYIYIYIYIDKFLGILSQVYILKASLPIKEQVGDYLLETNKNGITCII